MRKNLWVGSRKYSFLAGFLLFLALVFSLLSSVTGAALEQESTPMIATVTGTVEGPMAYVIQNPETQINLRSGPNTTYDRVGVLMVGQRVPALGQSAGGQWIQVGYPGVPGGKAWVWSLFVEIYPPVALPIIEPPPSPTPRETATIDPTLEARFIVTRDATRLPTFTNPPPLVIPTFQDSGSAVGGRVPMGFVIMGFAGIGLLFSLVAFFERR